MDSLGRQAATRRMCGGAILKKPTGSWRLEEGLVAREEAQEEQRQEEEPRGFVEEDNDRWWRRGEEGTTLLRSGRGNSGTVLGERGLRRMWGSDGDLARAQGSGEEEEELLWKRICGAEEEEERRVSVGRK